MGVTIVCASRYAVTTHEMWASPPNSPTIVGNAVATIVESRASKSITSNSPPKTTSTLSLVACDVTSAEAAACIMMLQPFALFVPLTACCQKRRGLQCPVSNHNNRKNFHETNRYRVESRRTCQESVYLTRNHCTHH